MYVLPGRCDFGRPNACLLHDVTRLGGVIAHELQHALEIGSAGVTDAKDIDAVMRRIGHACDGANARNCYETEAAVAIQNQVVSELSGARARAVRR